MEKYATRQELIKALNSPVLYVSFENEDTIIAKKQRETKNGSPSRRYRKVKDEQGEFVWVKGIGSTIKSYRKDWVIQ